MLLGVRAVGRIQVVPTAPNLVGNLIASALLVTFTMALALNPRRNMWLFMSNCVFGVVLTMIGA